tara:strand:+ start:330 stop:512 length:183 start_codon:yes stop_codon:yes gene_type:complete
MKQLEFDFKKERDIYIPSFEDWYSENSHERRTFGERPYTKNKALIVYSDLVKTGFFNRGK